MKKINITIPEPCHQDWNIMTSTEKGKFCSSCTKEVFDFTHYSDEQLIKRFEKEGDLCGRFNSTQLNRVLILQRKKNHIYMSYAFSGLFSLLLLNSSSSKAQEKPKTIQTEKKYTSIPLQNTKTTDSTTVTGTVLDETNMPLPGTTVLIKGTTNGTSTNFDGKFSLECKKGDSINISYVGYEDTSFEITENNSQYIKFNMILYDFLGEVVIEHTKKRWIGGNLFTRFTNVFRKDNKNPKYRF